MVLEKDNAIADLRKLMGATNPANAEEGTIRKKFAGSIAGECDSRFGCGGHGGVRNRLLVRGIRAALRRGSVSGPSSCNSSLLSERGDSSRSCTSRLRVAQSALRELNRRSADGRCFHGRDRRASSPDKQMRIARFLGTWLARQHGHQRRLAFHQLLQARQDIGDFVEAVHALGAAAQLARCLRPAQQQHAQQRRFAPG